MDDIVEQVGMRIREIRLQKKWTQEQLAEKVGLTYTYIGRVERGQKNISLRTLGKIATALDVNVNAFFTYSDLKVNVAVANEKMKEIQDITLELYKTDFQAIVKVKPVIAELLKQIQK